MISPPAYRGQVAPWLAEIIGPSYRWRPLAQALSELTVNMNTMFPCHMCGSMEIIFSSVCLFSLFSMFPGFYLDLEIIRCENISLPEGWQYEIVKYFNG